MKYIIIGLGNYGHVLAEELSALGHEVIGADVSAGRVDSLKEKIGYSLCHRCDGRASAVRVAAEQCGRGDCCHRREFRCIHPCSGFAEAEEGAAYLCPRH